MRLIIQGDKIAALVGDDYVGDEQTITAPDGFDLNQAHKHRYDGSQIVRRVPEEITARQAYQALILVNKLHLVQPAINAISDPVQQALVQAEWDKSQVFQRNRPALIALATGIGMTPSDLDALFILGEDQA